MMIMMMMILMIMVTKVIVSNIQGMFEKYPTIFIPFHLTQNNFQAIAFCFEKSIRAQKRYSVFSRDVELLEYSMETKSIASCLRFGFRVKALKTPQFYLQITFHNNTSCRSIFVHVTITTHCHTDKIQWSSFICRKEKEEIKKQHFLD